MSTMRGPQPSAHVPFACTLGPDDGTARMLRWQRLHELATPSAELIDGRLEVRYEPKDGVQQELADLVRAESACCAFVAWEVSSVDGQPLLTVTAPAESPHAIEPVAALFGVPGEPQSR